MSNNLLSPVHIQKLGHPIEEIRVRALKSVASKYDLDLVDDSDLERSKLLLDKLINWFSFKTHPHEDKVLQLILKVLHQQNSNSIRTLLNLNKIFIKINEIENSVEPKFLSLIYDIKECLNKFQQHLLEPTENMSDQLAIKNKSCIGDKCKNQEIPQSCIGHEILSSEHIHLYRSLDAVVDKKDAIDINKGNKHVFLESSHLNECISKLNEKDETKKFYKNSKIESADNCYAIKIEYLPWQFLVLCDSFVLTSVYEGLRYIDNMNSILQSCQFYTDILLKDFPTEIFLQRTLLIQTFCELLKCEESAVQLPAITCLLATVKHLQNQFQFALNINFINSKTFYKSFTFLNSDTRDRQKFKKHILGKCMNSSNYLFENEMEDEELLGLKHHQYSVSQFCFLILSESVPMLLRSRTAEEFNIISKLVTETFSFLAHNITPAIWGVNHKLKSSLYKVFDLFNDPLKNYRTTNPTNYCIIVHVIVKILILLKVPEDDLQDILPQSVQLEFTECITDYIFILLFPDLRLKILNFVGRFLEQRKKEVLEDHQLLLKLCTSMKSAVDFLQNSNKFKTKLEKLSCAQKALTCLEFHRNFQFIHDVMTNCFFKWSGEHLKETEINLRKNILLKLLSHSDEEVKIDFYKELHVHIIKYVGVEESAKIKFQYPGNKFQFLFDSDVLAEIICHGLNSPRTEVQNYSSEIIIHLLKGKVFFSEDYWQKFMTALTPCLPLLQCFADKSTTLGRCILKMLDPDVSKTILLPRLDLIRGNLRLLYSKIHLVREEALLRLFWLMTRDDPEKKMLPRLNLLRGINLSSICSSVAPEDFLKTKPSFFTADSLCNVVEMLQGENLEPSVRRSALSQISVMLEDFHLHRTFQEQNGLQLILNIFKNCLVEKEFQNYPDSVVPIMNILKLICIHNPAVRLQLSQDADLYYCVLRGLLLFNSEKKSRQQGVELLCLLLYSECIVNVIDEKVVAYKISLPEIVINKICVPFRTCSHWKYSKHAEPSTRESIMLREKWASLLRIYWNIEWLGGISEVVMLKDDDLKRNIFSPSIPNDMMLKTADLKYLKDSYLTFAVRKTLFDIQNGTTHGAVIASLHKLNSYLILYKFERELVDIEHSDDFKEITTSLGKLQWESTFKRFFLSTPSCEDDENLLLQVVLIMRVIIDICGSKDLLFWIEKQLSDEVGTLPSVVMSYGRQSCGLVRRDLARAVTGLIQDILSRNVECLSGDWLFYVKLITNQLKLSRENQLYNIAHVDWLVSLLVVVTGRPIQNVANSFEFYTETISSLMELIAALHCTKDCQNSFLGTNIVKNCLHILNHLLMDMQATIKDWEHLWYQALSQVTGHTDQTNYCWFLSLWFVRDPIIRALAVQLLSGFSTTCRACELLIEGLHIEFEYIWNEGFKLLLDDSECSIVKEKSALLLSNLTCHGSVTTATEFLQNLKDINFYEKVRCVFESLQLDPTLNEATDSDIFKLYSDHAQGHSTLSMTTISLVGAVGILLTNIIVLNPEEVVKIILNAGFLETLTRTFSDASEACHKYMRDGHILDFVKMYAVNCKLIRKCITSDIAAYAFVQQSQQFINSLYCLMNYDIYDTTSEMIADQRNQLWCEILDLLSIILTGPEEKSNSIKALENEGFKALNHAMTENGTDYFLSSLYLALSSKSLDLRHRCLTFLSNLFALEANGRSCLSIADLFDRNVFSESVEQAQLFGWKALSICKRLDLNFGTRICDILLQSYSLSNTTDNLVFKTLVPDTLGSLLAVCQNAQNFCSEKGLADDIIENLRTAFIKLSLENVECLKKVQDRKRIDSILLQIETSYRLLTDLFTGNERIKSSVASIGLSSLVHNLWHWCTVKRQLLIVALKMLTTYTLNSDSATRSLAFDKSRTLIGLRKPQGATTLISTIMLEMEKEINLPLKNQQREVLFLSFQLMANCCRVSECRCLMAKGALIPAFLNLCKDILTKKRIYSDNMTETWFNFLIIFTSYQEGQLILSKNEDVLDALVLMASSSKCLLRIKALKVLRNISFHQLNRVHLLSYYPFLSIMVDALKFGKAEEVDLAIHAIWALTYNSQKGKTIVRNVGFEELLKDVKKKFAISSEFSSVSVVDTVLQILQNK